MSFSSKRWCHGARALAQTFRAFTFLERAASTDVFSSACLQDEVNIKQAGRLLQGIEHVRRREGLLVDRRRSPIASVGDNRAEAVNRNQFY